MEKEKLKGERPVHDEERMEMEPIGDGAQYRIFCKKCGAANVVAANNRGNGSAHCTGKEISVA
jgi:hypothetical protein